MSLLLGLLFASPAQAAGPFVGGHYVGFDYSIYEIYLDSCPTSFEDLLDAPTYRVGVAGNDDIDEYAIGMADPVAELVTLSLYDLSTHAKIGSAIADDLGVVSTAGDVTDIEPVLLLDDCTSPRLPDRWFVRVKTTTTPAGFLAIVR